MNTWRILLRPLSPWATPWRADSLFGAVCWRWLELFPESFESMLAEFSTAETPPFLLSDAWPSDLMPLPLHISPKLAGKKHKPPLYVGVEEFKAVIRGEASSPEYATSPVMSSSRIQASIDRDLGTAADGQLFETDTQHLSPSFGSLSLYIRSSRYLQEVLTCLNAQSKVGFGKKSSTGLGQFELLGPPVPCEWLDGIAGANSWTTISHFVPAVQDPTEGYWRTHVTYPKFHGNATSNVFKGTLVMLAPGSVFRTDEDTPRSWYGRTLSIPRPEMPNAMHYGLAFAIPLIWETDK